MKNRIEKMIEETCNLMWELSQIDGSNRHAEFLNHDDSFKKVEDALISVFENLKAAKRECISK